MFEEGRVSFLVFYRSKYVIGRLINGYDDFQQDWGCIFDDLVICWRLVGILTKV